jgi:hypothetical protein
MSLIDRIKKGPAYKPRRILLYGVEGIGKSTWASQAAKNIFLCAENGLPESLNHVDRINVASFKDLLAAIQALRDEKHDFKTVTIDTFDWLEPLLYAYICDRDGQPNIEDYGYGKGYTAAQQELRSLLAQLERLAEDRQMDVIILAHAMIKTFNNPSGDNFDRYIMKGNDKLSGLLKEWATAVLFARYEVFTKKAGKQDVKAKAFGEARVIHTTWCAAWDAKNHYSLPETMPLNYDEFDATIQRNLAGGSEKARETADYIATHFDTAIWPNDEIRGKALARLGGSIKAKDLAALSLIQKLQPAADYIRSLQPPTQDETAA